MDVVEKRKVLYITYDGLTDALGQSQILSYLTKLSKDYEIFILSFEKKLNYQKNFERVAKSVSDSGLHWIKKWYTKSPPVVSTLFDINAGLKETKQLHKKHHFDIVHCRGYIPALVGLQLKRRFNVKFIFDMRGWWPDEKVESGSWASPYFKPIFKYFKRKEKEFFSLADFSISLTEVGKNEIIRQYSIPENKIGVVPTCVNFETFKAPDIAKRSAKRKKLGIAESATVLIYSGALGGNYDVKILMGIFRKFNSKYPNPYILILSKDALSMGFSQEMKDADITNFGLYNVSYNEVSDYLHVADVGLIFYKPAYSNIGRNPTKLGEYWASGIPVLATQGIGDLKMLQDKYPAGLVLINNSLQDIDQKLGQLKFNNQAVLRTYAVDYCSLEKGVSFYKDVYSKLVK